MKLKHIPLQPPRTSVPMEGIYLRLWQNFSEQRPDEWLAVFSDCNFKPRQRAASVAASFMTFMGCNCGRDFTRRADELVSRFSWPEQAYIAAWALENTRHRGVNSNLRTIEYMLAGEHPIHKDGFVRGRVNWAAVPNVTQEDHDVIECMVRWWFGTTARVIRDIAAAQLKAHEENERLQHHIEHNKS